MQLTSKGQRRALKAFHDTYFRQNLSKAAVYMCMGINILDRSCHDFVKKQQLETSSLLGLLE